jgi:hypothetical protein
MPPNLSHSRRILSALIVVLAIVVATATVALGLGPFRTSTSALPGSIDRQVPPPAQLPAVPPPIRTDLPLLGSLDPSPSPDPTARPRRVVATRVIVRYLGIDLPIISRDRHIPNQGPDLYPPCDVAIYHSAFQQPGEPGTTYLYGHAREGMFLPLLDASERNDGEELIGKVVRVYTSDDRVHLYRITAVKRHATDFSLVTDAEPGSEQLILQTSEGPRGTVPKLQVLAIPYSVRPSTPQEAEPEAKPRACYDTP